MSTKTTSETYLPLANEFLDFINASVTPFHAVDSAKKLLTNAGFTQLSEREKWSIKQNGKYFYTRNQSTLIAFAVGGKYVSGNGFNIVGAHTDSPNLRIKPNPEVTKEGYLQLEIEPYGGGLWTTWFDRDLTIGGRVVIERNGGYESVLMKLERPILRIPTLAIHLDRDSGTKLEFNKQTQLLPILCSSIMKQLEGENEGSLFLKILAKEVGCNVSDIRDFEICVFDSQKSVIGGLYNEFIFSGRLDNLMMSFCGLKALLNTLSNPKTLENEENVLAVALFDNEEVGSESAHGAGSPLISELVCRVTHSSELVELALRRSFFISADMAHGVHPNYPEKHDPNHKPKLHGGVVIKSNSNQRYSSVAPTAFILRELAKKNNIQIQDFVVRNDSLCGSTIGPIVSAKTGIRTVDIGIPQLSMHSLREMCATSDATHGVQLLQVFFEQFTSLDKLLKVD